tara:strand:- start:248 stop:508 length:261 start_codon:yes stop_codon:yes gene_type:complete
MSNRIKASTIPQWLIKLRAKTPVNSRRFAEALGVSLKTFDGRVAREDVPKHDLTSKATLNRYGNNFKQWKAVTVRNYIRKLIREGR